jgi:hypothetical protein
VSVERTREDRAKYGAGAQGRRLIQGFQVDAAKFSAAMSALRQKWREEDEAQRSLIRTAEFNEWQRRILTDLTYGYNIRNPIRFTDVTAT